MSKTEQNSVEWLEKQIKEYGIIKPSLVSGFNILIKQAKAMHKEETCQFVSDYLDDADYGMTAEEYYNQIYGGNNE
jgi:hypothetical protein